MKRTNNAIEAILRIGNLSNRQQYEFEEQEVARIMEALRDAVSQIEERFASPQSRRRSQFRL